MFPLNQYNSSVTIYMPRKWGNEITWKRHVLSNVFWDSSNTIITRRGGVAAPNQISVHVPVQSNPGYMEIGNWNKKRGKDKGWAITIGGDLEYTLIYKGVVNIPILEEWQDIDEIGGEVLTAISRANRPTTVNPVLYGPGHMHRVDITVSGSNK